jgi:hypothetical protein
MPAGLPVPMHDDLAVKLGSPSDHAAALGDAGAAGHDLMALAFGPWQTYHNREDVY